MTSWLAVQFKHGRKSFRCVGPCYCFFVCCCVRRELLVALTRLCGSGRIRDCLVCACVNVPRPCQCVCEVWLAVEVACIHLAACLCGLMCVCNGFETLVVIKQQPVSMWLQCRCECECDPLLLRVFAMNVFELRSICVCASLCVC